MPAPFVALLVLLPGLALGSFLNVVVARVPRRESIVRPGSHCMSCDQPIAWYDNIPLFSYLALRGRCRHCKVPIARRYPLVEAVTALFVVLCFWVFGLRLDAVLAAFFCCALIAISAVDFEHRIIPNRIVLPTAAAVLAVKLLLNFSIEWPLAALAASGFLLIAALAYPGGMGMGDVKLALLLGAMLGRNVSVALAIGLISALVPAAWMIARHGAAARKMAIPFGPFLALGGLVALFLGDRMLDWYLSFM